MKPIQPLRRRVAASLACAVAALLVTACDSDYRSPTAPMAPPPGANYVGDAAVVSTTGDGECGARPGASRAEVFWKVTYTADSFSLYRPTDDEFYTGALRGRSFSASYQQTTSSRCGFRGAAISGMFSEDFGSFEAQETMMYGLGIHENKVEWHWRVRRL